MYLPKIIFKNRWVKKELKDRTLIDKMYALPRGKYLSQIISQFAAAYWVPQFAERFGFNLPDALTRDAKFLPYLFERSGPTVLQAETEFEHLTLTVAEPFQHILHLLLEQLA